MKALASAVIAVPLMACNYKGPAYDCPPEEYDADTGLCAAQDAGVTADGGANADAGSIEDGGDIIDVDSGTTEPEVDAGDDEDAGPIAESDAGFIDAGFIDAGAE